MGAPPHGVKQSCDADHSPLSSAKAKNERSNTSIPLTCLYGERRDKITVPFTFAHFLQYALQYHPLEFDHLNNISRSPSVYFLSILMLAYFFS